MKTTILFSQKNGSTIGNLSDCNKLNITVAGRGTNTCASREFESRESAVEFCNEVSGTLSVAFIAQLIPTDEYKASYTQYIGGFKKSEDVIILKSRK